VAGIQEWHRQGNLFPSRSSGGAIILECTSVDEAKEAFADFPLVRDGLIVIDAIPLDPFLNWEMLFSHAAEARATEEVLRRETNA
jgi:hypothetical protein